MTPTTLRKLRRLQVFVGKWKTQAASVCAIEAYEWMNGEKFLIHHFHGDASCMEVIGYDEETDTYPVHTFYTTGGISHWTLRENDGTWTLAGQWDLQGKQTEVRLTLTVAESGSSMAGKWESGQDNDWQTICEVSGERIQDPLSALL